MSVGLARIEHMFDKLAGLDEVELLVAMSEAQRDERRAVARRLVAAGRLCQRRIADSGEDEQQWCIDNWEEVAAEVGAELGVSRGRASAQMEYGKNLVERFPKLAQVFWDGDVDYRIITAIDFRTGLITDPEILQVLDAELAERAPYWNHLSRDRIAELIDGGSSTLIPRRSVSAGSVTPTGTSTFTRATVGPPIYPAMCGVWTARRSTDGSTSWPRRCVATTHARSVNAAPTPWAHCRGGRP